MRWGRRRRGNAFIWGQPRIYTDSVYGAAGRGDLNALEHIKYYRGISAFHCTLYIAAFASFRKNVVDWLVLNGVDFWCLRYGRRHWTIIGNEFLEALCARENKYYFICRKLKIRRINNT